MAERAEKLAAALTRLGVQQGDRVGTFCWNNQGHLEAYLAIPSMGAVLHTLNIRLPAEQLAYVINHAEDRVIIVDASLIPLLAAIKDDLKTVETIIVAGEGDTAPLGETLSYERLLAAEAARLRLARPRRDVPPPPCVTPAAPPATPRASCTRTARPGCTPWPSRPHRRSGMTETDRILIIVPMFHANAWGTPYGAFMAGTDIIMPQMFLMGDAARQRLQRVPPHPGLRRPHDLERTPRPRREDRLLHRPSHHRRRRRRPRDHSSGLSRSASASPSFRAGA